MSEEVNIKKDLFEKLCALQCDIKEIAATFGCTVEQVKYWCNQVYKTDFEKVYIAKATKGIISLRSLQFKLAEKSPTMAIYLGKIYLHQEENVDGKIENKRTSK